MNNLCLLLTKQRRERGGVGAKEVEQPAVYALLPNPINGNPLPPFECSSACGTRRNNDVLTKQTNLTCFSWFTCKYWKIFPKDTAAKQTERAKAKHRARGINTNAKKSEKKKRRRRAEAAAKNELPTSGNNIDFLPRRSEALSVAVGNGSRGQIKEILAGRRQSGGLRCQKGNWEFKWGPQISQLAYKCGPVNAKMQINVWETISR